MSTAQLPWHSILFPLLMVSAEPVTARHPRPPGNVERPGVLSNESRDSSAPVNVAPKTRNEGRRNDARLPRTRGADGRGVADLKADRPRVLSEPFQHPRQLLHMLDIGPSDLDSFVDGQPITAADEEAFLKVLFRMPQIGWDDIDRWLRRPVPWRALAEGPASERGEFFQLQGRVRRATPTSVRERPASLFGFQQYFEVSMDVSQDVDVTVFIRGIPQAWQGEDELDQRCRVAGMFLKLGELVNGKTHFLFAARRIAWLPDQTDSELGVGPDHVLLGNLGMDVGLFDAVRSRNGLPIDASERECFYALLRAAGRAAPTEMARHASLIPVETLLQDPERLHGTLLRVTGSVQRITRIVVDEPDIQQRYGIDAYYQLDVLVPLGELEVRLHGEEHGAPGPVYRDNFPCTCCTLSIPAEWEPFVGQEQARVEAILDGFFYKLWSYSNPYVASFGQKQRQLSPMLILRSPRPLQAERHSASSPVNVAVGIGFLVALVLIWVIIWLLNRADRKHASPILQTRFSSRAERERPNFQDLDGLND